MFDGEASELCQRLNTRGVPYVLHSGYSLVDNACRSGLVVVKPASPVALVDALSQALAGGVGC